MTGRKILKEFADLLRKSVLSDDCKTSIPGSNPNLRSLRPLRRKYTIDLEVRMRKIGWVLCAALIVAALFAAAQDGDWSSYGRDPGGERFSPLDGIKRENVGSLQAAWT